MANKNKIINFFTKNIGYKILAFVLACFLWFIVYNVDNPSRNKAISVSVTITNASVLSDLGKCYQILDNSDVASFIINAPRSTLDSLSESDFIAVADLTNMEISEDGMEAEVPVSVTAKRNNSDIKFTSNAKPLHLSLENLYSKKLEVEVRSSGEVAAGYALQSVEVVNPTVITVQGPESVVMGIEKAVATLDVTDMNGDFTDNVKPVFFDADGKTVDMSRILSISSEKIVVQAHIQGTKSVPISFNTMGAPANGYEKVGITSSITEILIQGDPSVLEQISKIEVPSSAISIAGATSNVTVNVDISEFIPEGVQVVKHEETTIAVTVEIKSDITESFTVPATNISVVGLDTNLYTAKIVSSDVTVRITGKEADLERLSVSELKGSIDLSDYKPGNHAVSVKFDVDSAKYAASTVTVNVSIEAVKKDNTSNGNSNTSGGNTGSSSQDESSKVEGRSAEN